MAVWKRKQTLSDLQNKHIQNCFHAVSYKHEPINSVIQVFRREGASPQVQDSNDMQVKEPRVPFTPKT
jgi:hypothetical protein